MYTARDIRLRTEERKNMGRKKMKVMRKKEDKRNEIYTTIKKEKKDK